MKGMSVKLAVKLLCFLLLTCLLVAGVNRWLIPEYYYDETWSVTNTFRDFYGLEKNSVDVLFFGSSHAVSSFDPQVLYDDYGITSFNLGCEQQSIVMSYYWLREALKTQSPKAVVLETYVLHRNTDKYAYNLMNCSEPSVRKAMDYMRFSPLKVEAAKTIVSLDSAQNFLSFFLPNIRYHARWADMGENDFDGLAMTSHGGLKGFNAIGLGGVGLEDYNFREEDADQVEAEPMIEVAETYLDKIREVCDAHDIRLVFACTPADERLVRHKATKAYADRYQIPFYDFNEQKLFDAIGYDIGEDSIGHPNYKGAAKITHFIGGELKELADIPVRTDPSFERNRELRAHKIENLVLVETDDMREYLSLLDKDRYTIFIFGAKAYSTFLDDALMEQLFALGCTTDLRNRQTGERYCAVLDQTQGVEKISMEDFQFSGSVRNGKVPYQFLIDTSVMVPAGQTFSMVIDHEECGNDHAGLNIVVYDNEYRQILDKVNFDTETKELVCTRW